MFITHRTQETIQYERKLRQIARNLRKNLTPAEDILWQHLRSRKLGYKFRRQHSLHGFIVDFYCYELMLVIEVDGAVHQDTAERDHLKDKTLAQHGYRVIRFSNDSVLYATQRVIEKIKCYLPNPLS